MAPTVLRVREAFRDAPFIAVGLAAGGMAAFSVAMIAAVGRMRGGEEATWLHMTTLVAGTAVVIGVVALRGRAPAFARPLDCGWTIWTIAALFAVIAVLSVRGIAWYYLASGSVSVATFVLLTWLLVRVNLAFYFASTTFGQVAGSLVMDEIGAFGAPEHEITVLRAFGVVLVAAGVVAVRTGK